MRLKKKMFYQFFHDNGAVGPRAPIPDGGLEEIVIPRGRNVWGLVIFSVYALRSRTTGELTGDVSKEHREYRFLFGKELITHGLDTFVVTNKGEEILFEPGDVFIPAYATPVPVH